MNHTAQCIHLKVGCIANHRMEGLPKCTHSAQPPPYNMQRRHQKTDATQNRKKITAGYTMKTTKNDSADFNICNSSVR